MEYNIKVDNDKCIGCGGCEAVCPENFSIKNGKAIVKKSPIEKLKCEEEAKEACPVGAISIVEK